MAACRTIPFWAQPHGDADELIGQLTLNNKLDDYDITVGMASGFSDNSLFTQASFNYLTYEPNPRMIRVTLENPDPPVVDLSDTNGVAIMGDFPFSSTPIPI